MSGEQHQITEFPEGDDLWLVKWIDEFRLPHLKTRSASVGVVLQQLSARDFTELDSLKANQLSHILGRGKEAGAPVFKIPRVMVGSLPVLEIGQIFQNRVKVGQLPTSMATILIYPTVPTYEAEVTMEQEVPPPPWWKKGFPHKTLNAYEYVGLWAMGKSRCDVIRRREGIHIHEYIIPKTVIFKAFYGLHTEMAKAFCNGPWSKRFEDVICMHDFESGLKTQKVNDGKQWNIVLETLVPNAFAYPLALLFFDDYARKCAEAIYTRSQQDKNGKADAPWYASAKIPYFPIREPFNMRVKCLPLPVRTAIDDDETKYEIRRFLVTSIVGSSWPSHLPIVGIGRRNSGIKGEVQVPDGSRPPYVRINEGEKEGIQTTIDGTSDADTNTAVKKLSGEEWIWLNEPKSTKLTKNSSKKYEGNRPVKQDSGDRVSTGEHTHEKDGLGKGQATTLVRSPERRFEQIIKILDQLKTEGILTSIREVPAPNAWQQTSRGGRSCWSFIAEETAKLGKRPGRTWRIVDYSTENSKNAVYRCALVLELEINGRCHYWIEIECRKKDGFRSPFLSNLGSNYRGVIESAIEIIAIEKGKNLEEKLKSGLSDGSMRVDSYKHYYPSKDHSELDISSVRRFLTGR